MKERLVSFHVDNDSPKKILEWWGYDNIHTDLDSFYDIAMDRALSLFKRFKAPATFFCVGEDLAQSIKVRELIREAFSAGHEIANHTYSHPFSLKKLGNARIRTEIEQCSSIIKEVTGIKPVGFRAPGYDISNSTLDILEQLSFKYDSSAFCSLLNPFLKYYYKILRKADNYEVTFGDTFKIPNCPYYPSKDNWKIKGSFRDIVEIPIPRTTILNLPFYNNIHRH
jgi:peptidoglycan/xylan/chitin deacetylase (PgdA/CDA1 family)